MIREKHLIWAVAKSLKIPEEQVKAMIDKLKEFIIESLEQNDRVHLVGLGTFKVTVSKPRKVFSIQSKEMVKVKSKNLVRFYPAVSLRRKFGVKRPFKTIEHIN